MFRHRLLPGIALAAALACASLAAPAPPAVKAEIAALFARLQAPGCRFNRNGTWYSGAEAQDHLARKLEYLEGKGLVKTTEDFIALAAATSSSSGKAYLVRCGEAAAVESRAWLLEQLGSVRNGR